MQKRGQKFEQRASKDNRGSGFRSICLGVEERIKSHFQTETYHSH